MALYAFSQQDLILEVMLWLDEQRMSNAEEIHLACKFGISFEASQSSLIFILDVLVQFHI